MTTEINDIVQIAPVVEKFAGCCGLVTEVKSWGVVADVLIPAAPSPNVAPIRLTHEQYERIGKAVFVPAETL